MYACVLIFWSIVDYPAPAGTQERSTAVQRVLFFNRIFFCQSYLSKKDSEAERHVQEMLACAVQWTSLLPYVRAEMLVFFSVSCNSTHYISLKCAVKHTSTPILKWHCDVSMGKAWWRWLLSVHSSNCLQHEDNVDDSVQGFTRWILKRVNIYT